MEQTLEASYLAWSRGTLMVVGLKPEQKEVCYQDRSTIINALVHC